jgi:hypothetical protein
MSLYLTEGDPHYGLVGCKPILTVRVTGVVTCTWPLSGHNNYLLMTCSSWVEYWWYQLRCSKRLVSLWDLQVCHGRINMPIIILELLSFHVFYLKDDVSETGLCVRLQVKSTQLGIIELIYVSGKRQGSTWSRRQNQVSETQCFKQKTGNGISRIVKLLLINHLHKPIDSN